MAKDSRVVSDPQPEEEPGGAASTNGSEGDFHLSKSVQMDHWLSLLVVVTTCLLLTVFVGIAVHLLGYIGHTILIFSLAGLLAYALDPLVEKLRGPEIPGRKRRTRTTCALLVLLGILGLVGIAGVLLGTTMAHQLKILEHDHILWEADARNKLDSTDSWLAAHGMHISLSEYVKHPPANAKSWGETVAKSTFKALEAFTRNVVEAFIVLLIATYYLIYCEEMRVGFVRGLHERLQPYATHWQDDVNAILGGFVRGQAVLALTIGALATVLCFAMGLRLWLLLGLFVVVASLIPVVGPIIGAVPAIIAALLSPHAHFHPVARIAILLVCFTLINELGSKVLYPKLVGAALGLHEVLVLFILLAGWEVAGLTGVLFAAPLTALAVATVVQLYRFWQGLPPASLAQTNRSAGQQAKMRGAP